MSKEYHKIETPFERDTEGTKKLIIGKFRNPAVEFLKDAQWVWTEKIDGTNVRVIWDGHKVTFKGRTEASSMPVDLFNKLQELFGGPVNEELFEQMFGEKEVVLYGEGYGNKIQKSGKAYLEDSVNFIMFDIRIGDRYLDRSAVPGIAAAFNVESVPISLVGTIDDAINYVRNRPTSLVAVDKTFVIEGVVGTPKVPLLDSSGGRIITKVKVCDFV